MATFSLMPFIHIFESTRSRGRVARQSSAKAPTAVRIRSRPLVYKSCLIMTGSFYFEVIQPILKKN